MEERTCVLVIIGATEDGTKELVALEDGYRESGESQEEVLLDLKSGAWSPVLNVQWEMVLWDSGRLSSRYMEKPIPRDAGCPRPVMYSIISPRVCCRKPKPISMRYYGFTALSQCGEKMEKTEWNSKISGGSEGSQIRGWDSPKRGRRLMGHTQNLTLTQLLVL